jgi:AraC-like DNA-binding protein
MRNTHARYIDQRSRFAGHADGVGRIFDDDPDSDARDWQAKRASGGLAPWQARRIENYTNANLSKPISLADLANECRLSPSYFSVAFKKTVGCAPHRWLLKRRVERAAHLLLTTKQPLVDIALSVGFADQSHFTRVFARYVRATPAAWRRACVGLIESAYG